MSMLPINAPWAQPIDIPALNAPQISMPPQAKRKGGMFGGGTMKGIAGVIGDFLMQRSGMQPVFLPQMMQRRQQEREDAQYQQQRQDGLVDYEAKQKIEAQYGRAPQPHYFEDNSGNLMQVNPATGKPEVVYKDPNPWKFVPNGMGGVVPVNIQQYMQGGQQALPQTLSDDDWNTGGPAPQAPGGFR